RRVGAEERGLREVERVLHVARGMVARDVQRLEVEVVGLDLGPLADREAEAGEDRDDLVVDAREGMERAAGRAPPRQREIEPLARSRRRADGPRTTGSAPWRSRRASRTPAGRAPPSRPGPCDRAGSRPS